MHTSKLIHCTMNKYNFYSWINKSHHITFDVRVRFIKLMIKTNLCVMPKFVPLMYHRINHLQGKGGKERDIYVGGDNNEEKEEWILSFNISFIDFDCFFY